MLVIVMFDTGIRKLAENERMPLASEVYRWFKNEARRSLSLVKVGAS